MSAAGDFWVSALSLLMLVALVAVVCRGRRYLAYRLRDFFTTGRHFAATGNRTAANTVPMLLTLLGVGCACLVIMATRATAMDFGLTADWAGVNTAHTADWAGVNTALTWLALVVGALVGKVLLHLLGGWVFFDRTLLAKWLSHYLFLTAATALPLYPIALCHLRGLLGTGEVTICLLAVLILYEILLFYRLMVNFPQKWGVQLLVFAYLCTLEIQPLLLGWRFLAVPGQG